MSRRPTIHATADRGRRPAPRRSVAWAWPLLLTLCICAAGCATVKRARAIQNATRFPPGERTVTAAEVGLDTNSVLELTTALQIASVSHPLIAQASQNLVAASVQIREAEAAARPALSAGAGYRRGTANAAGTPASHSSDDSYSAALDLNLLLYDFGKTPARVRQARARRIAAAETLRAVHSDIVFGVRTAYLDLGKSQELLRVAEEALRQYQSHLTQVRAYAEVGRRIRYDVIKAEVDLGNAQLNLINASNAVVSARAGLNRSLGLAEDPPYRLGSIPDETVGGDETQLMAQARTCHPELRALLAQEQAASAALDEAIADLYPALNLQAEYGLAGDRLPLVWNWWGALRSAVSLFSGGQKMARIDASAAQLRAARAAVANREQQIYLDLRQAWNQWDTARQRLTLTDLIVREAQESLDLVAERYRLGQASAVEVTDAQVALTSARADQVKARFDCQAAIAQIKHAIGEQ